MLSEHVPPALRRGKRRIVSIPLRARSASRFATKSKGAAEAARARIIAAWSTPPEDAPPPADMDDLLIEYEQWNRGRGISDRQVASNSRIAGLFADTQDIADPADITLAAVDEYMATTVDMKRQTRMNYKHAISLLCRWLMRGGYLDSNPAALVELGRRKTLPVRTLTESQVSRLLDHDGQDWLRLAVRVALYQGLRVSEIRNLWHEDVSDEAIIVGARIPEGAKAGTKTGDYRVVPVFGELRADLPVLRDGTGPIFPQHKRRWWQHALHGHTITLPGFEAGGKRWHLLRSTFAVRRARGIGLERGATQWELMAWLGHRNPTTTMKYLDVARAAGIKGKGER